MNGGRHEEQKMHTDTLFNSYLFENNNPFFHFYCDSSLQLGSYMILYYFHRTPSQKLPFYKHVDLFFVFFVLLSFLYDLCFDIFEREKEIF